MNVESLRSGDQSGESAEIKIAKVLIANYKHTGLGSSKIIKLLEPIG